MSAERGIGEAAADKGLHRGRFGFGFRQPRFELRHSLLAAGPVLHEKHHLVAARMGDAIAAVASGDRKTFVGGQSHTYNPWVAGTASAHGLAGSARGDEVIADGDGAAFESDVDGNPTGEGDGLRLGTIATEGNPR